MLVLVYLSQAARSRETPEGCALRREQNAARMEMLRGRETPEQAADRRARNAVAMQVSDKPVYHKMCCGKVARAVETGHSGVHLIVVLLYVFRLVYFLPSNITDMPLFL